MATTACRLCVRWACKLSNWSGEERIVMEFIQKEEVHRIMQFKHNDDIRRAIIGRLMLRKGVAHMMNIEWKDVRLERTEKGKPILHPSLVCPGSFNISHDGDWILFASSCSSNCGVDVMNIKRPNGVKDIPAYIKLMSRQFSSAELESMRNEKGDKHKLALFYRYWCLKESYIKAQGIGIHSKLSCLDFRLGSENCKLSCDKLVENTWLNGAKDYSTFVFEESLLDNNSIATVCIDKVRKCCATGIMFSVIDFDELVLNAQLIHTIGIENISCKV